jgi:hypothetical protein
VEPARRGREPGPTDPGGADRDGRAHLGVTAQRTLPESLAPTRSGSDRRSAHRRARPMEPPRDAYRSGPRQQSPSEHLDASPHTLKARKCAHPTWAISAPIKQGGRRSCAVSPRQAPKAGTRFYAPRARLPSWPCGFDSRHPLHSVRPSQRPVWQHQQARLVRDDEVAQAKSNTSGKARTTVQAQTAYTMR